MQPLVDATDGDNAEGDLLRLALERRADDLFALWEAGAHPARAIYQWLHAALDLQDEVAEDRIGDLVEVSDLRYDDDAIERAVSHWQLAARYAEGRGLAFDLTLAKRHLREALRCHPVDEVALDPTLDVLVELLDGVARALIEQGVREGFPRDDVEEGIERVERLIACGAPHTVIEGERQQLKAAADVLFAAAPAAETAAALSALRQRVVEVLKRP